MEKWLIERLLESIEVHLTEPDGMKRSQVLVRYRFTAPEDPSPLIWQQVHAPDRRNPAPIEVRTLGDHLRRRRLALQLPQHRAAEQIGVSRTCINNWEHNRHRPAAKYVPEILRFLGCAPKLGTDGWPERLFEGRTRQGLTRKEAALRMGVDPSTLARWERGERQPSGDCAQRAERFLDNNPIQIQI